MVRKIWHYIAIAGIHIAIARGDAYLWYPYARTRAREQYEIALAFESGEVIERGSLD